MTTNVCPSSVRESIDEYRSGEDRAQQPIQIRAYNRGCGARQLSQPITANPYHPAAACLWSSWVAGWEDVGE